MVIVWFRRDLRLGDNPALVQACEQGEILPVYILDDTHPGPYAMGAASRVWLHHALRELRDDLHGQLYLAQGDPQTLLSELMQRTNAQGIYWNRCYEPWQVDRDIKLKTFFKDQGYDVQTFNGSLLWEPWQVSKDDGTPYRVFTPFYKRGCLAAREPRMPLDAPTSFRCKHIQSACTLEELQLLPSRSWDEQLVDSWVISEEGAYERLDQFLEEGLDGYKKGRDFPAMPHVSKLSPYLHFGQISPHQVWHAVQTQGGSDKDRGHFLSELGWREFSYHLLYHFNDLPEEPLQSKFKAFPWVKNDQALACWQRGKTGYPIIDAAMRQLWQTGIMHNRLRMIVASFLVKNLMIHWHKGRDWFWDCLVDADLANNSAGWQWVAGCGADAAPYFRIFNPVTQSEKFDPDGSFIRQYVPELAALSDRHIHAPWKAPADALQDAGIELGRDYPEPIIDLGQSRQAALEAFHNLS